MQKFKGFQKPKRLEPELETLTNTYGKFFAEPLERGFGLTLGNSLRRVLLSAIEGAAAVSPKAAGPISVSSRENRRPGSGPSESRLVRVAAINVWIEARTLVW